MIRGSFDIYVAKKVIGNLIDQVYRHTGQKATVIFCDQIMALGFKEGEPATAVDEAVIDLDDLVATVLAHAAAAVAEVDVALPGAPAQPVDVTGHRLDLDVDLEAGQAHHLLAHDAGLQRALRGQSHVLQVATAAQSRTGEPARRLDAVRRGLQHLHGVTAPEPVALGALGDLDDHALAGQRVPDEHDRAVLLPQHAVPAVGDGSDHALEARADRAAHRRSLTSPRRRSPGRTRVSSS